MAFFSAGKNKTGKRFPISVCGRKRSFEVMYVEQTVAVRSKPEGTLETVSLKMRQLFVFITPISLANLALKNNFHNARSLQESNARSAANQSARTLVATE